MTVTLDYAPPNKAALLVFISGVRQDTDAYTLSGTSLTFTGSVPSGTNNVQVVHLGLTVQVPAPADDTITTAKIQDDAVTTAKILDDNVTTAKILDNNVTLAKMAGLARGKIIYGDTSGDPAALTVGSSGTALTSDGTDIAWGTVGTSWQSVQTTGFTAVAGNGYPCNTTGGAFTVTLPASASVGDTIELIDYAGTFDTNALTLEPQSLNLKGASDILELRDERQGVRIVYVDATQGWVAATGVNETDPAIKDPPQYVAATGPDSAAGTIDGDYKYHTFTASKTGSAAFVVSNAGDALGSNTVEYLVIAGGGGGGATHRTGSWYGGGGGGAGGYRTATGLACPAVGNVDVTVGAGGAGGTAVTASSTDSSGATGSDSVFATITSDGGGGGGGGTYTYAPGGVGKDGGSGGGGGGGGSAGGSATAGQGYDGGDVSGFGAAGGGGSSAVGAANSSNSGGAGGDGTSSDINAVATTRAGGGGGGAYGGTPGTGGSGGGGAAGAADSFGSAGTVNTGSGSGGASRNPGTGTNPGGGSGLVIIRYQFQN